MITKFHTEQKVRQILPIELIILFVLNASDIFFTLELLKTGLCIEMNIFMVDIVTSPILALALKLILVGSILYIFNERLKKATYRQLYISDIAIKVMLFIYILINLLHIFSSIFLIALC